MAVMRRGIRSAVLIGAMGSALAAGGCGGEAPPTQPAGDGGQVTSEAANGPATVADNPCDLFSQEEAAAVAGHPVTEGQRLDEVCIWEQADVTDSTQVQVSVGYVLIPPGVDVELFCESALLAIPDATPLPDTILGHTAYTSATLHISGDVHVCLDTGMIQVQVIGGRPREELHEMAVSIATTVVGRV